MPPPPRRRSCFSTPRPSSTSYLPPMHPMLSHSSGTGFATRHHLRSRPGLPILAVAAAGVMKYATLGLQRLSMSDRRRLRTRPRSMRMQAPAVGNAAHGGQYQPIIHRRRHIIWLAMLFPPPPPAQIPIFDAPSAIVHRRRKVSRQF